MRIGQNVLARIVHVEHYVCEHHLQDCRWSKLALVSCEGFSFLAGWWLSTRQFAARMSSDWLMVLDDWHSSCAHDQTSCYQDNIRSGGMLARRQAED